MQNSSDRQEYNMDLVDADPFEEAEEECNLQDFFPELVPYHLHHFFLRGPQGGRHKFYYRRRKEKKHTTIQYN